MTNISTILAALPMADRLSIGGKVFVVGILTVFAVLIILWLVLLLFRLFFYDIPTKRKAKNTSVKTEVLPDNEPVAFNIGEPEESYDDAELIAVITAAIEAYNSQSGNGLPFRVVSYKRLKGANGWNGNDTNETI